MPRKLTEIIAHIRAVAENPAISATLIQTEDLLALCDAAEQGVRVSACVGELGRVDCSPDSPEGQAARSLGKKSAHQSQHRTKP